MDQPRGLMEGVQVLELAQGVSGPYCGKILAAMGAEVIKIEPRHGDRARRLGPYPDHHLDREQSGLFLWLNANKFGITLELDAAEDWPQFKQLIAGADIIIDGDIEGRLESLDLGYDTLRALNPGLILTTISGFGVPESPPYQDHSVQV